MGNPNNSQSKKSSSGPTKTAAEYQTLYQNELDRYNELNAKITLYQSYYDILMSWATTIDDVNVNITHACEDIKAGYKLTDGTSLKDAEFSSLSEAVTQLLLDLITITGNTNTKIGSMRIQADNAYKAYTDYYSLYQQALQKNHRT